MSTNTKSLVSLSILVLCTACVPRGLSTAEPSAAVIATHSSPTPAATSTLLLPTPIPILDVVIDNLAIGPQGQLYAGGYGNGGQQLPQAQLAQWDGEKWIALDSGFQPETDALVVDNVGQFYAEFFTDSQQGLSNAIMRWDGARWEDISGNFGTVVDVLKAGRLSNNIPVVALAVDGEDNLYAAGSFYYPSTDHTDEFPMGYVAEWNKETWTVLGDGFDRVNVFALAASPTGEVFVSGEQPLTPEGNSSFIAQWDGEKWRQINSSKLNITLSIASDKSGGLYAGTQWSVPGQAIAYWDGTNWITITDQLEGEAPAVFDMAVDANGHLYIGGSFESVSGNPARNIAYWDGTLWHALGDGVNRQVDALAFDPGGKLYAVGFFTEAGGVPAHHAARWDGETWHALVP